jgi:hypothetical protein
MSSFLVKDSCDNRVLVPQRNKRRTLTTVENHVKLLALEDLCKSGTWKFDEPLLLLSIVYEHNIYYQTQ